MVTKLKFNAKGRVTFNFHQRKNIVSFNNTVLANAKNIMAARLANITSSKIDFIKVYNNGLLLCAKEIVQTDLVSANEVQYISLFTETDFSGTFDEVQLWSDATGGFAQLTGFPDQNKLNTEQLSITWKIKIL